jgi:ankyrin repeat protein
MLFIIKERTMFPLQNGETAAHMAAGYGQLEVLTLLQKHGANLQKVDEQGDTPLMSAAKNGHSDTLQFLIQAGVVVGIQNRVRHPNCC